ETELESKEDVGERAAGQCGEGDGFGKREAQSLDPGQLAAELELTRDGLDHRAGDVADPDAGADRAEPDADSEGDRLAEISETRVGGCCEKNAQDASLVFRFDCHADVDG